MPSYVYSTVSQAIGTEVQKALQGQKTAVEAITAAHELVTAIVKRRG
jgi:multiple sugar transport system substrate-binding protein